MKFLAFAGAVFTLLGTLDAAASTVELSKQYSSVFGPAGGKQIVSSISNRSGSFYAGGFRLTDGTNSLILWCIDIAHNLTLPSDYTTTDNPWQTPGPIDPTRLANIKSLFQVGYPLVGLNNNDQSGGFQMALWELMYENTAGPFNVTSGTWKATSTSGAQNFANLLLANLGGPILQPYKFTFYESTDTRARDGHFSQDLVGVTPVPVPVAGLLLGSGLLALFGINRRKKLAAGRV